MTYYLRGRPVGKSSESLQRSCHRTVLMSRRRLFDGRTLGRMVHKCGHHLSRLEVIAAGGLRGARLARLDRLVTDWAHPAFRDPEAELNITPTCASINTL